MHLDLGPAAPWIALAVLLVTTHFSVAGVTMYLHRSMAHRSVTYHPAVAFAMRFWLWLGTAMVTKEWVAVHRKHHVFADVDGDPHSPRDHGVLGVLFLGVVYYRRESKNPETLEKYGKGTPDDWMEHHVFTPLTIVGPLLLLLAELLVFGPAIAGIIWILQMLWIPFWAAGVINGVAHGIGYRNHDTKDTSRNLVPWAVWLCGEELHNNHHNCPGSANFASRWWEFDLAWAYIAILKTLGLAQLAEERRVAEERRIAADRRVDETTDVTGTGSAAVVAPKPESLSIIPPVKVPGPVTFASAPNRP